MPPSAQRPAVGRAFTLLDEGLAHTRKDLSPFLGKEGLVLGVVIGTVCCFVLGGTELEVRVEGDGGAYNPGSSEDSTSDKARKK